MREGRAGSCWRARTWCEARPGTANPYSARSSWLAWWRCRCRRRRRRGRDGQTDRTTPASYRTPTAPRREVALLGLLGTLGVLGTMGTGTRTRRKRRKRSRPHVVEVLSPSDVLQAASTPWSSAGSARRHGWGGSRLAAPPPVLFFVSGRSRPPGTSSNQRPQPRGHGSRSGRCGPP